MSEMPREVRVFIEELRAILTAPRSDKPSKLKEYREVMAKSMRPDFNDDHP